MGKAATVVTGIVSFLGGLGIGGVAVNIFFKQKYEQKAEEEIASVRAAFANAKHPERKEEKQEVPKEKVVSAVSSYTTPDKTKDLVNSLFNNPDAPYMIEEDDFRSKENDGYRTIELRYYLDDVLTKGDQVLGDDIKDLIGTTWREKIADDDFDEIYIRNDKYKVDVAVSKVLQKYHKKK